MNPRLFRFAIPLTVACLLWAGVRYAENHHAAQIAEHLAKRQPGDHSGRRTGYADGSVQGRADCLAGHPVMAPDALLRQAQERAESAGYYRPYVVEYVRAYRAAYESLTPDNPWASN